MNTDISNQMYTYLSIQSNDEHFEMNENQYDIITIVHVLFDANIE